MGIPIHVTQPSEIYEKNKQAYAIEIHPLDDHTYTQNPAEDKQGKIEKQ